MRKCFLPRELLTLLSIIFANVSFYVYTIAIIYVFLLLLN